MAVNFNPHETRFAHRNIMNICQMLTNARDKIGKGDKKIMSAALENLQLASELNSQTTISPAYRSILKECCDQTGVVYTPVAQLVREKLSHYRKEHWQFDGYISLQKY